MGGSWSIEMPCLDSALIYTNSCPDDKFLRSLSSVPYLWLYVTDETVVWCSTIKFYRLTECRIFPEENSDRMKPIILLLRTAPKLKHLIVDVEIDEKQRWEEFSRLLSGWNMEEEKKRSNS
ncbi:predicted protein [Arabidopsis lyrata subsp. lyrata]|uniref:Predicted protein n=1 Tax=Arabidopsis lyrata subsp. lyrata TaxID=81972 RepID=D7M1V9_ARALL|nr:predicted protein [Arabidopsis lyrata subsp. lyrata]